MITAERLPLDFITGDYRYRLSDGTHLRLRFDDILHYGEDRCLDAYGVTLDNELLPVEQFGKVIGTLPKSFYWRNPGVRNPLVDVRPDDFKRSPDGLRWIASRSLGPGDLEAIPSFRGV